MCRLSFFNKYLFCFPYPAGSPRMQRVNCVHWSRTFYIGDFSIPGFGYPWGSWNLPPPWFPRDNLSLWGVRNYMLIFDCAEVATPPKPHVVQELALVTWWFTLIDFSKVKLSLHFWDKSKLTMIYLYRDKLYLIFWLGFVHLCLFT